MGNPSVGQTWNSQHTPHSSPSWVSYGVYVVSSLEMTDCVQQEESIYNFLLVNETVSCMMSFTDKSAENDDNWKWNVIR